MTVTDLIEAVGFPRCPRCGMCMGDNNEEERAHAEACLRDWYIGQALSTFDYDDTKQAMEIADRVMRMRKVEREGATDYQKKKLQEGK